MTGLTLSDLITAVTDALTSVLPAGTIALLIGTGVVAGLAAWLGKRFLRAGR